MKKCSKLLNLGYEYQTFYAFLTIKQFLSFHHVVEFG